MTLNFWRISFNCIVRVGLIVSIIAVAIPSASSENSLLFADHLLSLKERKEVAKYILEYMRKYDSSVPSLSPREEEYVRKELVFVRNDIKGHRAQSFIISREFLIWSIRQDLDELIALLKLMITGDLKKYDEIQLWARILYPLINDRITGNYDAAKSRGYVEKDLGYQTMITILSTQILGKMIIEQLK